MLHHFVALCGILPKGFLPFFFSNIILDQIRWNRNRGFVFVLPLGFCTPGYLRARVLGRRVSRLESVNHSELRTAPSDPCLHCQVTFCSAWSQNCNLCATGEGNEICQNHDDESWHMSHDVLLWGCRPQRVSQNHFEPCIKTRSCPPCYGLHPLWALAPWLPNIDSYGLHVLPIAAIHIYIMLSSGSEFFTKLISTQALEQLLLVLSEDKLGWNGRNTERNPKIGWINIQTTGTLCEDSWIRTSYLYRWSQKLQQVQTLGSDEYQDSKANLCKPQLFMIYRYL